MFFFFLSEARHLHLSPPPSPLPDGGGAAVLLQPVKNSQHRKNPHKKQQKNTHAFSFLFFLLFPQAYINLYVQKLKKSDIP